MKTQTLTTSSTVSRRNSRTWNPIGTATRTNPRRKTRSASANRLRAEGRPLLSAVFGLLLVSGLQAAPLSNQLAQHPSPYLALHGEDPTAWQSWTAETLQRARQEHKLVYVSVGYFACHWCHVMQQESYRSPAIAERLNRHFIPVKVDRELAPALDAHLLDFVERTRGHAGWPLNVFLTPEGYPLLGFVYQPPERFAATLDRLVEEWRARPEQLQTLARAAAEAMAGAGDLVYEGIAADDYRRLLLHSALAQGDSFGGGFGHQSKFPLAPRWQVLLELYDQTRDKALGELIRTSLDAMAEQGLRDQVGGGFFRYTVDPAWQIPHFEKMLYDNALLARVYLRAAEVMQAPRYREIAFDTLDFMLREMRGKQDLLIASLSALDAAGREGGYYLWQTDDLALDKELQQLFEQHWRLAESEELEGGLPVQRQRLDEAADALGWTRQKAARVLQTLRRRLAEQRRPRGLPRDHKTLAGWNGLALQALAEAAGAPGGERFADPARKLARALQQRFWDGDRLWRYPAADTPGEVDDYAHVAAGLLAWAEVADDAPARRLAGRLVAEAFARFHADGYWRRGATVLIPMGPGQALLADGALPSPSAGLLQSLRRLGWDGRDDWRQRYRRGLWAGHTLLLDDPLSHAGHVLLLTQEKMP